MAPCIPVVVGYSAGMKLLRYWDATDCERIVDLTLMWDNTVMDIRSSETSGGTPVVLWSFRDGAGKELLAITARTTLKEVHGAIEALCVGNPIAALHKPA